ncbi:MAG: hypothetical protein RL748_2824, partial [Pseudomonadota bacterium]
MTPKLPLHTALLLTIPPVLWAGNAVVGRLVHAWVPPVTLNLLRWVLAFFILLPMAASIFKADSGLWQHWKRFALLGLLGVGLYNALQYLALQSSSPINVTLVAASMPVWMLGVGWLFYGVKVSLRQLLGALLSIIGVLVVLSRGQWQQLLAMRLVAGDLFILLATLCWAFYSWLLIKGNDPAKLKSHWARFLLAQVTFGIFWSAACSAIEWAWLPQAHILWSWQLLAALAYIAIGPAVIAFRCWGAGVQQAGPNIAAFFGNLTPLFAALLSSAILGELPHLYHLLAFVLIVSGIVLSSR